MFAALIVASCSAMADTVQVSDLTLTRKALAYATKTYTIQLTGNSWDEAEKNAEKEFNAIAADIAKACTYEIDYEMPEFKKIWVRGTGDKVKGSIKFTAPSVKNGVASTKVVTTKINGLKIDRASTGPKTYLWDDTKNEYVVENKNYKFWGVLVPAVYGGSVATADGKASVNMTIADEQGFSDLRGVATGTSDKNTKAFKSVAGNFADTLSNGYGTWKLAYNKKVSAQAATLSDEQILELKKVELAK